eukprot:155498_1
MSIMSQYSEDKQWYLARINKFTDTEVHVTYIDYGNEEWVDPLCINIIDNLVSSSKLKSDAPINDPSIIDDQTTETKRGIRIGDKPVGDNVSNFINSQLYKTSRFLTDTVRG